MASIYLEKGLNKCQEHKNFPCDIFDEKSF